MGQTKDLIDELTKAGMELGIENARIKAEYFEFLEFVRKSDPSIYDAWTFILNARESKASAKPASTDDTCHRCGGLGEIFTPGSDYLSSCYDCKGTGIRLVK